MSNRELRRTGKPLGRPPGTAQVIPSQPEWLVNQENYQLLIHWLSIRVPVRKILEYCTETEITVPGGALGNQLQTIANFTRNHREEIVLAHDAIRAVAMEDAQKRRAEFLAQEYAVRDWLYEHMRTDRDASGRTHMVRDYIHHSKAIAELEGFKKGTFDPREKKAIEALTDFMFGDKDAATAVEPKVTVLQRGELSPSQ